MAVGDYTQTETRYRNILLRVSHVQRKIAKPFAVKHIAKPKISLLKTLGEHERV